MKNKLTLSIDLKIVSVLLLAIIVAMLAIWQPWQTDDSNTRTITVSGTGKVTAQPDTYQFNPTYQKATTEEVNTTVSTVTAKLKELGVEDKHIQVQSSAYRTMTGAAEPMIAPAPDRNTASAYLTIKVSNKELAQKVQDYIATTGAEGQLTANPSFSDDKQKQLKEEARNKAIADAKSKADKTAQQVNAKLGKVLEVKDSDNDFGILMKTNAASDAISSAEGNSGLSIYAGEQDISFTVEVVYQIK